MIRAVAAITGNELRRVARDRTAMFFVLVMPVIVIVIVGSASGAAPTDLGIGVIDEDRSPHSAALVAALDRSGALAVERYEDEGDLRAAVRTSAVAAGVVVPAGYGGALDGGGPAEVRVVADPAASSGGAVRSAVGSVVAREAEQAAAAAFATEHVGGDRDANLAAAVAAAATTARVDVDVVRVGDARAGDLSPFSYTAPANLVLFLFVNSLAVGAVLATDRHSGMVRRLLATPNRVATVLLGIGAAKFTFALLQAVLILAIGALLFDVDWGHPVAAGLLTVVFALVSTAVGLLVGATVRSADTAQAVGVPLAIGMGMLGGCMWPLEIVPSAMRAAGHVVPHAWAMDGWIDLVLDGGGLGAVAPELAVLTAYAAVLLAAATWRLRVALTG